MESIFKIIPVVILFALLYKAVDYIYKITLKGKRDKPDVLDKYYSFKVAIARQIFKWLFIVVFAFLVFKLICLAIGNE